MITLKLLKLILTYLRIYNALNAFNMAKIETPTSAKTACHILDMPIALNISTINFIDIANIILLLSLFF